VNKLLPIYLDVLDIKDEDKPEDCQQTGDTQLITVLRNF
jgi:hypothetical protein